MAKKVIEFGCWEGLPIEWLVIGKGEGDQYLCLAKEAVLETNRGAKGLWGDRFILGASGDVCIWSGCALRKWLNEVFLFRAFSEAERRRISYVHVKPDPYLYNRNIDQGEETEDRVFLLSAVEALWLLDKKERKCEGGWMLRTAGEKPRYNINTYAYMGENGDFDMTNHQLGFVDMPVRPSIVISIPDYDSL